MLLGLAVASLTALTVSSSTSSKTFRLDEHHTLTAELVPGNIVVFTVEDSDGSWYADRHKHPATLNLLVSTEAVHGHEVLAVQQFVVKNNLIQHSDDVEFFDERHVSYKASHDSVADGEDHSFESSLFVAVLGLKSTDPLLELVLAALQVRELQYQGVGGYGFWPRGPASCEEYIDHLPTHQEDRSELRQCDDAGGALKTAFATVWRYY